MAASTYQLLTFIIEVPDAALKRQEKQLDDAIRSGLAQVATAAQHAAVRRAGRMYARFIPTRAQIAATRLRKTNRKRRAAGNAPAWQRHGTLLRAIQAAPLWEGSASVALTADVPYAEPRQNLGVTWTPANPALGIIRRDPFFAGTRAIIQPRVPELFAAGFNQVWER